MMQEWNIVVTLHQDGYRFARRLLRELGPAEATPYHNVVTMSVDTPTALLDAVEKRAADEPRIFDAIARIAPVLASFSFESAQEFEEKARAIVLEWSPRLAACSFHVRLHRRGFKHKLSSPDEERFLDDAILDAQRKAGAPGSISFSDPDWVVTVDTIDNRAGMAIWSRDDIARHPLLRPG